MLVQIDGIRSESTSNEDSPVLVIATTRNSTLVDPALLRPGRIDVHIPVDLPNKADRSCIVADILSEASNLSLPVEDIDQDCLVHQSDGWSTADVLAFV